MISAFRPDDLVVKIVDNHVFVQHTYYIRCCCRNGGEDLSTSPPPRHRRHAKIRDPRGLRRLGIVL